MTVAWPSERAELLVRLWGEGKSASQCAAILGGGVTRNGVIGKLHRLGLSGGNSMTRSPGGVRKTRKSRNKPFYFGSMPKAPRSGPKSGSLPDTTGAHPLPQEEHDLPVDRRVKLVDLKRNGCRYPFGDPRHADFGFCCETALEGKAYCDYHDYISHQQKG